MLIRGVQEHNNYHGLKIDAINMGLEHIYDHLYQHYNHCVFVYFFLQYNLFHIQYICNNSLLQQFILIYGESNLCSRINKHVTSLFDPMAEPNDRCPTV